MTRQEINDKWLKDQCNRYVHGQCQRARCVFRTGGNHAGSIDYDKATCEPHQILTELEFLRDTYERYHP